MTTATHGPLFYRMDGDLVSYTCDCGHETPAFMDMEYALKSLAQHIEESK